MKPLWPDHYCPPRHSGVDIIETVARHAKCSVADMKAHGKNRRTLHARSAAATLLRAQGVSLPVIGRMLNRDHTTVIYSLRNFDRYAERAPWLRELVA